MAARPSTGAAHSARARYDLLLLVPSFPSHVPFLAANLAAASMFGHAFTSRLSFGQLERFLEWHG